ncbi:hypothetical protein [Halobellus ordinarius]|uniref:hypothetical protein n=1 Tax=Halobellus ordinarius TaxID=3075120 RepID=UPI0028807971|nr:hypothetical protein [Halobellus sp. ZY16]
MSSDDEGYVHRPGEAESVETAAGERGAAGGPAASKETAASEETPQNGFGARGWVLVAVLAVCTLVVPGIIYVRPGILSALGIPYIASLLVLPLLPAAALGLTAVWAMAATNRD